MNKIKEFLKEVNESISTNAYKGGSYALSLSALVIAIIVVTNIAVSLLPSSLTRYDISSSKLYSITSNTKVVINALDEDVTIYWIVQADKEDSVIENLLERYDSLSDHISVVKKNPDIYPTFTSAYTNETVANNSLIVESGSRYRYIAYDDIYLSDYDYTYYTTTYSFDGEGAITSAIDYVTAEELPKMYILEGHGETQLSSAFSQQIEKENIETESVSLLNIDMIPEDADMLLIHSPSSDISPEEKDILADYVKNGGKILIFAGSTEEGTLVNLYDLLADYGVEAIEGVVIDPDRDHYAFQMEYILLPDIQSDEITDPLIDNRYYVIVPIAQGLQIDDDSGSTVTELLKTSSSSYSKIAGYQLTTYEKEEGDIEGPFTVGVSIETSSGGQIICYASSDMLDESFNAYSSGANLDLTMNSISSLIGEREAISIRSKSLSYSYLTISDSDASFIKTVMIILLPAVFVGLGIYMIVDRRKKHNG